MRTCLSCNGAVVEQKNILVTAFHPELTNDNRWHHYFLQTIALPLL